MAEDRFFSSLYGKSLSGLSFFTLSLVSIQQRHSFPIQIEQTLKTASEKLKESATNSESGEPKKFNKSPKKSKNKTQMSPNKKAVSAEIKNLGGRPKGSKNKDKTAVTFTKRITANPRVDSSRAATAQGLCPTDVFIAGRSRKAIIMLYKWLVRLIYI